MVGDARERDVAAASSGLRHWQSLPEDARGVITEPVLGRHVSPVRDPRTDARLAVTGRALALGIIAGPIVGVIAGAAVTFGSGYVEGGIIFGAFMGFVVGLMLGSLWAPLLGRIIVRHDGVLRRGVVVTAATSVAAAAVVPFVAYFDAGSLLETWPGLVVAVLVGVAIVVLYLPWCARPLTDLAAPDDPPRLPAR